MQVFCEKVINVKLVQKKKPHMVHIWGCIKKAGITPL